MKKRKGRKLPVILEKEEQKALLDIFNCRYPTAERNKTMIMLMLDTGLRLDETTTLKWENVNLMTGKIEVKEGKGAKDRIVWFNDCLMKQLQNWKERQAKELIKRDIKQPAEYVFTTLEGTELDNRNVRRMVTKYAKKAGITKRISPHTLRHSFATDLYRETKNIRATQKALGHSDLSTTMIYTHIVDDELENAMKSFRVEL
ncbi:MAG: tyrosine-type recombinase/integrase [bacterium]